MPRFVIQHHIQKHSEHWDLMLHQRHSPTLATWQVPIPPDRWGTEPIVCKKLHDHRLDYLTYQGPVSGDRGTVEIVAAGSYHAEVTNTTSEKNWHVTLRGDTIHGTVILTRGTVILTHTHDDRWTLTWQGGMA